MPNNKLILRTLNSPYIGNAGDITKGNVLTHNELDENFIFLKGEDILSATTNSTILTLHKVNTSTVDVDLASMIAGADTFTSGTTLVGSTLYFNRTDAYSAYTADLSPLLDDTNFYTTGGTLVGQAIVYDRNDTLSAYTIDVSGLVPEADNGLNLSGNTIELGGILNKNTTISGASYNLTFGDTNSSLNQFDVNSILSTQKFTAPGYDYVLLNYYPGFLTKTISNTGGTETNVTSVYKNQFITDINKISTNEHSRLNLQQNDITLLVENTSTGKYTSSFSTQTSHQLRHNSGSGVNNQLFLSDNDVILSHTSGSTTHGVTINENDVKIYSTNNTQLSLGPVNATFTDYRPITKGIEYAADYTTGFTDFTLITRQYFDDNNKYTTGGTLNGGNIIFDRNDALSAYTVDVSGFIPDVDYGNVIYVSEVGPTGDTRADIIGNPLKPVGLEWASQIAQSGDTIHVEAGIYNITTTGASGLSVVGVNHYFEQGAEVYKSTTGVMFNNTGDRCNVYGFGSFYGSDSCGVIYYCIGGVSIFEFDRCIHLSNGCYYSIFNDDVFIRGKKEMISYSGVTISNNNPNSTALTFIDCPLIRSTTSTAVSIIAGGGAFKDLLINSMTIENTTGGAAILLGTCIGTSVINANFVNNVNASAGGGGPLNLLLNVKKINDVTFVGSSLKCTGHIKNYNHTTGVSDIHLCDKITGGYGGSITTTLNGLTGDTVSDINNTVICNLKLSSTDGSANLYSNRRIINISGLATVNLESNWDCLDLEFNLSGFGSTLNIPNNSSIKIAPGSTGTTFNVNGGRVNLSGKIIQNTTEDTHKIMEYSVGGSVVYNGATIIVSSQDKQVITTNDATNNVKIYTGGLNTNKLYAFNAEQEKRKVNVSGTGATITISGETFISTTGTTNAQIAAELTTLINASGTLLVTATQDTPGTDTYFYIEADIAGEAMTIVYNLNTSLNEIIRYNNKGVYDIVGGPKIEDSDID